MVIDFDTARAAFDASQDFTVGLEEEFALLDPDDLGLTNRFDELEAAAAADPVLAESISGELIASEIEIRSGRGEDLAAAILAQRDRRRRLFALADEQGVLLGATGTHPWSDYRRQEIIQTEHYQRVAEGLQYVARRNNTFSLHVHVGVRGADRAVQVCDRLRGELPLLLAVSSSSPYLDGRDSGLHSARSQIFTKSFPRCGIPDAFGDWDTFATYVDFLCRTNSIVEYTQLWWSIRPHFSFGTVEVRICDSQITAQESEALASLIVACVAQAARDVDAGVPFASHSRTLIEENLWRAIRHGVEGEMIDFGRGSTHPATAALERLTEWCAPVRAELGIDVAFPQLNGTQRQRRMSESGIGLREVYSGTVAETRETYAGALEPELKGSR
jgi:glutamate---cysteine ligase / carboxylate-amine ligase